jgi:hypothetical protein
MNTPTPPSDEKSDNALLQAYRSSSERDLRAPHPKVHQVILGQAARVAEARSRSQRRPYFDWRWKAAASLVLVGLVGVLTLHTLRWPHQTITPVTGAGEVATPVTTATPRQAPAAQERAMEAPHEATGLSEVVVASKPRARNQQEARPAPPTAQDYALPAPAASGARAAMAPARAPVVTGELSSYWIGKVTAALCLRYPELISNTADATTHRAEVRDTPRVALVLKPDGTVYRSIVEDAASARNSDPSVRLHDELGVKSEELVVPAQTYYMDRISDTRGDFVITLGVLRGAPGNAQTSGQ